MSSVDGYRAWKARQQQQEAGKAGIVLGQDWKRTPDQFAADLNFAKEASAAVGNPVPLMMVQDPNTRTVFQRIIDEKKQSTILTQAPKLSSWLRVEGHADLARDDLEGLGWWEATLNLGNRALARNSEVNAGRSLIQFAQSSQDAGKSYSEILETSATVDPLRAQLAERLGVSIPATEPTVSVGDMLNAGGRLVNSQIDQMLGADPEEMARFYADGVMQAREWFSANPAPDTQFAQTAFSGDGSLGQSVQDFAAGAVQDPIGMLTWAANIVGENAASLAPAVVVGAATGNPIAGASVAFGSSYQVESALSALEYFNEQGVDLSTEEGLSRLLTDPALLRDAAQRGHTRGLIIGAFEAMGIGLLGKAILSNPLADVALQAFNQAVLGSTGEAAARVASGQDMDFREVLAEGLAGVVTLPLDLGAAGRQIAIDTRRATASAETVTTLTEIAAQATASVTRTRSPDTFRDFIATVTANGGRENLFVPAAQFVEYFQSAGLDPFELADQLSGMSRADVETAIETGGSVQIPTATWAADMAGSEHDQFVIQNSAFSPDAMTSMQAAEFEASKQELLAEAWAEAEAVRVENDSLRQIYDQELEQAVGALRAAGRATDIATAEALPLVAFRRTMAERMSLTPEEFAARYPLPEVRGERPVGLDPKNVDELTRTLAEARGRRSVGLDTKKTPLLEFISERGGIVDPGGELRNLGADVVKRPGKKTLRVERQGVAAGMRDMLGGSQDRGLDTTARAAVESGFLGDDPDVLAWLEAERNGTEAPDLSAALLRAIEREVAGEVDVAVDNLGGIEEYLAGLGLSLDDADADIRAAIEGEGEGRAYGQPAHLFTQTDPTVTPAFREWFGDSKVVGPDGKPLVVYHGSRPDIMTGETPDIEAFDTSRGDYAKVTGTYFSVNPDKASRYAFGGSVYLAYVSISKPASFADIRALPKELTSAERQEALIAAGFDGYIGRDFGEVVAFEPTQIKSVNNRGTFDPTDPRILNQADAGFQGGGGQRASIQFPGSGVANGQTIISLFKTADLSSFLHETGHYFLTVTQDMARLDPTGQAAAELETVRNWWRDNADAVARDAGNGVTADDVRAALDNGTSGDAAKDRLIDTGMQEQWARATEQYFLEGKAPSQELRGAFEKFSAWLLSIYKNLRGLNVQITDELRGVFDRMLATDTEIDNARADIGADVNLTADDLGMTAEQFAGFLKLRDQARDEAKAKLLAQTMAPIERARQQWFKDERKKVRADVERNMNAQSVYRAIEWMGNRRWLGDAPEGMPDFRLSKDVLVDRYGAGVLTTLPRGQQTVYAVDGGLDPDDAAGWFGFSSGDAMVQAMERAPNRKEAIEAETDVKIRERHGDALRDGSVEELALEAVHNDKRGRVLSAELAALNEIAGTDRGLTAKDARESARRTMAAMKTRDALRSGRFLAAERKAAGEVARLSATVTRDKMWMDRARRKVETQARGAVRNADPSATLALPVDRANQNTQRFNEDAAALVEAKRRQLMNHALYSEALAIADEVAGAERLVAKLVKAIGRRRSQDGKQTISNDHLDAIAELIERYDFRKMSGPAENRRGALNRYVEAMIEAGRENELAIPKKVLEGAGRVPYRTLPVSELRGVVDTLKNLESMGRRWQKLLIAEKTREMDEAVDTIVTALRDNIGDKPIPVIEDGADRTKAMVRQYLSTFTTASTVIRQIDGRENLGPVYELLKSDIDNATYTEREMRTVAADDIERIYSVYSRDEQRQMAVRRAVPELGQSYSKWNLISMALNMGNEGNVHRLTNKNARNHLTPMQMEAVKGMLDKRDWDFVQSVWDYLDTYRPKIAERQKRVTGVEPEWVEATAVQTPHGTYRGGYYPIKYDGRMGGASTPSVTGETDIIRSMQAGSYSKAATKNGHLESRVANISQSLSFDVGVIATHTNEVIHDLTFSEPIVNTWRLLNDKRVADAMISSGMQEQAEGLKLWLKDAAVGQVFAGDSISRTVRSLRSGFTVSRLAFSATTALLQPTGLMQSAVVVGKRQLANSIMQYMRNPKAMADEVVSRSRVMRERRTTFQKDLMDMVAETNISSPTSSKFRDVMDRYAVPASLAAMTYTQFYVVDVPTWAAAYDKGLRQFAGDEARAAVYADMTINRVQGGGLWTERSNIERGTLSATVRQNAFVTLFTTLGSYFFAKMNLLMERTDAVRAQPVTVGTAASYAFDVTLLLAGEAAVMMLAGAAKDALFGGDDDDEDENPAMTLGVEAMKVFAAGLPGIRDGVSVMQGFSGGTYAGVLDILVKPGKEILAGDVDKALVKSFVNLGGVLARLPASQANRIIDAGWRDLEGEDVAPMEYLLGKPR